MPDEYEPYPKICECCPAEFDGDDDAAKAAGWRLGWDGWLCGKCNEPAPNSALTGAEGVRVEGTVMQQTEE